MDGGSMSNDENMVQATSEYIQDLLYISLELSGVIAEYRSMPCDSLKDRMFQTLDRYMPRINNARCALQAAPIVPPVVQSGELPAPRRYFHTLPLGTAFSYIGSDEKWIVLETHGCGLVAKYAHHDSNKPLQQICSFEDSEYAAQHTEVDVVPLEAIAQTAPAMQAPIDANNSKWIKDIQERLIEQSAEIAAEGHDGWANTMAEAACLLKMLNKSVADPIVATVPSEPKPIAITAHVFRGRNGYELSGRLPSDTPLQLGSNTLYAAPSTAAEQASDVRNAVIDECAMVAYSKVYDLPFNPPNDKGLLALSVRQSIIKLKSATPADKGNAPAEAIKGEKS